MQNFSSLASTQTDQNSIFLIATYGICDKYWFRVEEMKKIFAEFHVLGLFMAKKHDLREKNLMR
jgi:hypothetical protein